MKKVLIITYYWPPSGGSGVQRWLKFAKYLPENKIQPFIYTPENPYPEVIDKDLLDDIPKSIKVWKSNIWEPYHLKDRIFGKGIKAQNAGIVSKNNTLKNKLLNWIRGNLFIPDPKIYWVNPSISLLLRKIQKENIEYVITTGPPHSMHLIGLGIKDKNPNIKWIADFRDPWSELDLLKEFHLFKSSINKHQKLEKRVLENANVVLTVSESWVNDLKRLGANRVELITNGYDSDDFLVKPKKNDKFIIGHYGLINHLRNPRNLWKTLAEMCLEDKEFNKKLEIHFAGNVDEEVIKEIRSYDNLKYKIKQLGYLSHSDVLEQYNEAAVLLLLLFNSKSGKGNYPGKIFEYFAANKPVLAFGPKDSDVQKLIKETRCGIYHSYLEDNLRDTIRRLYESDLLVEASIIDKFSRKSLTVKLANLIQSL